MLFHVRMTVNLPHDMLETARVDILAREKAYAQDLQRAGTWRALWRVVGKYENISIFDVESPAHLHDILSALPLFPYMEITVEALCTHPSALEHD
ncbi:muconolactone Delta-isomerase [uncultured Tateyamaria sp.]|uniref:muconolactone Delta-isomerase n=1 Tax=uncultured Tateyamaria sp. TaxID=455651 RepID=UPI0026133B78|nr:muconolactone Delta-isomerase [uncultured Tateyamaria sp.]